MPLSSAFFASAWCSLPLFLLVFPGFLVNKRWEGCRSKVVVHWALQVQFGGPNFTDEEAVLFSPAREKSGLHAVGKHPVLLQPSNRLRKLRYRVLLHMPSFVAFPRPSRYWMT